MTMRRLRLLLFALIVPRVQGHIRNYCETRNLPLVKVARSNEDSLTVLERWHPGDPDAPDVGRLIEQGYHRTRRLGEGHDHTHAPVVNSTAAFSNETRIYYAKQCTCFEGDPDHHVALCPLVTTDCREIINNHLDHQPRSVTCYDKNNDHRILMIVLYAVWISFFAWLFLTHRGRSALSYIPATFCCKACWNPAVAEFSLRHRKKFAYQLIRNHILVQEEQLLRQLHLQRQVPRLDIHGMDSEAIELATLTIEPAIPKRPTSLALKTRTYRKEEQHDKDETQLKEDEDSLLTCSICLATIDDGDRVGDFECPHLFHTECLKLWLQRRNTCPLCQTEQVAEPRFDEEEGTNNQGTEEFSTTTATVEGNSTTLNASSSPSQ